MTATGFIELPLPYDWNRPGNHDPLVLAVDQIESIRPSIYRDSGSDSNRDGSLIRTRSGETHLVAMAPVEITKLVREAELAHMKGQL